MLIVIITHVDMDSCNYLFFTVGIYQDVFIHTKIFGWFLGFFFFRTAVSILNHCSWCIFIFVLSGVCHEWTTPEWNSLAIEYEYLQCPQIQLFSQVVMPRYLAGHCQILCAAPAGQNRNCQAFTLSCGMN